MYGFSVHPVKQKYQDRFQGVYYARLDIRLSFNLTWLSNPIEKCRPIVELEKQEIRVEGAETIPQIESSVQGSCSRSV